MGAANSVASGLETADFALCDHGIAVGIADDYKQLSAIHASGSRVCANRSRERDDRVSVARWYRRRSGRVHSGTVLGPRSNALLWAAGGTAYDWCLRDNWSGQHNLSWTWRIHAVVDNSG